jgi:dTDP-4-amino-4,6-dideoxygalactose transaminase
MSGMELEYVKQAFESNYIAPIGPQLNQFEEKFREITGFKHCVAVSSGTAGIHLALRAAGVSAGDVVLGSTLTFIGSVAAVKYQNAELVFIDSEPDSWNMDPNLLGEEIDRLIAAGKKPAAVLPTELYGQPCDMDRILAVCQPHDIPVICDSAESLGASYKGQPTGRKANVAISSFNGNKIITTSGGGMVASDDKDLIDRCRYLATQARQPVLHYEHSEVGYNYRMSNVVAAIGIGQLEVLADRVNQKRQIAEWYRQQLEQVDGLKLMPEADFARATRWLTVFTIDPAKLKTRPLEIVAALEANNIESRPVWKPLHVQKAFADCRSVGGDVAMDLYENGICLPCGTLMTEDDVSRVCDIIKTAVL